VKTTNPQTRTLWARFHQTHPAACALAEAGRVADAVNAYAQSGCYLWTPRERVNAEKAERHAGLLLRSRNRFHKGARARNFYLSFARHLREKQAASSEPADTSAP